MLARWLSADPAGITDGLNRYRYARCNPVANTDPSGRQSVGILRGMAELSRRDLGQKQRLLSQMAPYPEQYPTVTEQTKNALSTPAVVRDLAAWRSRTWGGHRSMIPGCVDSRRSRGGRGPQRRP